MAKARVKLVEGGPLSFEGRGYSLAAGKSAIITNPSDIRYFRDQHGFEVTMLDSEPAPAPAAAAGPKPGPLGPGPSAPPAEDESRSASDETPSQEEELMNLTKAQLLVVASEVGAGASGEMNKAAIVKAILEARNGKEREA